MKLIFVVFQNPAHLDGVPDMSALIYLEAENVLHNLGCRYAKDEIYTNIAKVRFLPPSARSLPCLQVLIAINPYQDVPIYSPANIKLYRRSGNKRNSNLPPHVFAVSQSGISQTVDPSVHFFRAV